MKRNYKNVLNVKLTNETKYLFNQFYSLMRVKTGSRPTKSHVARHAIAITRDYYAGKVGYQKGE